MASLQSSVYGKVGLRLHPRPEEGALCATTLLTWPDLAAASLIWDRDLLSEAVLGIGVAHLSHLLSVLVLYRLGISVWRDRQLAFVAAGLHIVSPAGIFLSAPYAESTFALLSFAGYFFYVKGCRAPEPTLRSDAWQLLAAVFFGVATIFRSNGIINGIPFACEAAQELVRFLKRPERTALRRLVFLGVGGLCVAAGSVGPQLVAYQRYCSGLPAAANPRPWCTRLVPSIYTYVQELYWYARAFSSLTSPYVLTSSQGRWILQLLGA